MPRHQLGEKAMTDAKRQHKRRERLRQEHDEQRKRKEAGAQYLRAAKQAWVDDHPDHTTADFDHWGGDRAAASGQQAAAGTGRTPAAQGWRTGTRT